MAMVQTKDHNNTIATENATGVMEDEESASNEQKAVAEEPQSKPEEKEESSSRPPSRNSAKSCTPGPLPQYQYSKDQLLQLSKTEYSKKRPECLDPFFMNNYGVWDPEKWFMSKRQGVDPRNKRDRPPDFERDLLLGHKRRTPDPKERIKDERDDIVLSPQRRSFGTGCHVSQQSSLARQSGSPVDAKDDVPHREPSRRIGSGRIISRDRDQRDWEREHREYGYGSRSERRDRFDRDDKEGRFGSRHSRIGDHNDRRNARGRSHRIDEEDEPEWFRGGPTSQSDTIELVGFDDIPEEKKPDRARKAGKETPRRLSITTEDDKTERSSNKSSQRASPIILNGAAVPENNYEDLHMTNDQHQQQQQQQQQPPPQQQQDQQQAQQQQPTPACSEFDINDMFRSEWFPNFFLNDTPPEEPVEVGESRFSQFFKRNSPIHAILGSASNSRRSSMHDELMAGGFMDSNLNIHTPPSSDNYLAPMSPVLPQSYEHNPQQQQQPVPQPPSQASQRPDEDGGKNILAMLQGSNVTLEQYLTSQAMMKEQSLKARNVEELEASLKQLVLGSKDSDNEDKSVFNKLVSQLSDGRPTSPSLSLSMGPLDKSKALQEEDLIQNMFRDTQPSPQSHTSPPGAHMPHHHPGQGSPASQLLDASSSSGHDLEASTLMPGHVTGQTIINMLKENENTETPDIPASRPYHDSVLQDSHHSLHQQQQHLPPKQDLSTDVLSSIFNISAPSPLLQQHQANMCGSSPNSMSTRNGNQTIAAMLQQQKQQQDLLSMLVQQQQQIPSLAAHHHHHQRSPVVQDPLQPPPPPMSQTLGLPVPPPGRVLSPCQSPLPDAISPILSRQNRSPSPLVFGQQPPVLSHAPAPIHPSQIAQGLGPAVPSAGNTLQVQSSSLLPRVPSPQELVAHTQSILQNALIKHKLAEQREKFRKQQEAQRARSPTVISTSASSTSSKPISTSPSKGISSTMAAFTPTSVMRKMHSEKLDKDSPKFDAQSSQMMRTSSGMEMSFAGGRDSADNTSAMHSNGCISNNFSNGGTAASLDPSSSMRKAAASQQQQSLASSESSPPRSSSSGGGMNGGPPSAGPMQRTHQGGGRGISCLQGQVVSNNVSGQGRPIVKGSNLQSATNDRTTQQPQKTLQQYGKNFPGGNAQGQLFRSDLDSMAKILEQQQRLLQQQQQQAALAAQRQLATSPMPPSVLHPAFGIGPRAPNITHHPSARPIVRPGSINLSSPVGTTNINHHLLRTMMHNPAALRAQANSLSQLSQLNQLAVLQQQQQQQQQRQLDPRQLQALSQARGLPPLTLHQLLLNAAAQNQAAAAAAAASASQVPSAGLLSSGGGAAGNSGLGGGAGTGGSGTTGGAITANARGADVCNTLVMPKAQKLTPCQNTTSRHSPVNLAKWFGSDVLKQKMPELPPVPHQKALLLEDVERQQQQAAAVHN